jgi:integrase/recombinase XerD
VVEQGTHKPLVVGSIPTLATQRLRGAQNGARRMILSTDTQRTTQIDDYIEVWSEAFIIDRRAGGLAAGTVRFYIQKLKTFCDYCEGQAVTRISQITPAFIREYLLFLEQGHNPGGIHACYRVLKTFLFWWEAEVEPDNWRNPIRKVKAPRVAEEPIEGVSLETVMALVKKCNTGTFAGDRDRALLLALFDTGARASEFLAINLEDVNQATGEILIRKGKGSKPRYVFLGKQSRRALRRYLKYRTDNYAPLWVSHPRYGISRLAYDGLRSIIVRRSREARVEQPALHDFRRGFALAMLRAGVDLYTLSKLMGHEGIAVLSRYLKLTDQDVREAHRRASPVDNL